MMSKLNGSGDKLGLLSFIEQEWTMNASIEYLRTVFDFRPERIVSEYLFIEFMRQQELADLLNEGLLEEELRTKQFREFRITDKGMAEIAGK